jgi:hypothetical protein
MVLRKNRSDILPLTGPWPTKSGGELSVLLNFNKQQTASFTGNTSDLGGLRIYRVTGLSKGATGANEWHKVRTEMAFVARGGVTWNITHADGSQATLESDPYTQGVMIPPGTMHTYKVTQDDTELLIITNTVFDPDDTSTHDTYSHASFKIH